MKLSEIVALAKAGFTPGDVREFLAAEKVEAAAPETLKDDEPGKEPDEKTGDVENVVENVEKDSQQTDRKTEPEPKQDADYKKLYEESQAALKLAQEANTHKEIPPGESSQDIVNKLFQSIV